MIYVGQTRSRKLIADLADRGWGECTCRGEYPPRRRPWFYDNGAFRDWRAGVDFNAAAFAAELAEMGDDRPAFVVAPDIVGGGAESLARSSEWLPRLDGFVVYLAVQDGMKTDVDLAGFGGVFVGGTLPWKCETGGTWVRAAHGAGLPCHIGRVGTPSRVHWARAIGADSIDSCLPLWSRENLKRFAVAVDQPQLTIWS